jgi:DNA-binding MarR family transcriptional regulator
MVLSRKSDPELVLTLLGAGARVERRLDRALANIKGISFSEFHLLRSLGNEHNATATRVDLASAVGLTPSGVTRALRPLEKLGFVKTTKDARDARRALARLTPQGVELVSDAAGVVGDVVADLAAVGALTADDRKRVLAFLQELAHG